MAFRKSIAAGVIGASVLAMALATPASAQVRDAVYRGTLVCSKLPFQNAATREAIEVTISGNFARYTHVVRDQTRISTETGAGSLDGQQFNLRGSWRDWGDSYDASYQGNIVRRSARIQGTQTWSHDGKSYTRRCTGSIKRPFAVFLPHEGKKHAVDDHE